jgi:hypothetical protein
MDHKEFSSKGGRAKSEKKTEAARKNAAKPRGNWATAVFYEYKSRADGSIRSGLILIKGKVSDVQRIEKEVESWPLNQNHLVAEFLRLETLSRLI